MKDWVGNSKTTFSQLEVQCESNNINLVLQKI